uniref:Uncharacterized protein n=1 Tax=Glossina palpalis gambiensis TaxID=67801 RepID=A0A1B0APE2_9MUSC
MRFYKHKQQMNGSTFHLLIFSIVSAMNQVGLCIAGQGMQRGEASKLVSILSATVGGTAL